MSDKVPLPPAQLLLYRFGPGSDFQGQLTGALERIEVGGSLRVLEALFVTRAANGELSAVALRGDGTGGIAAPLIGFRLDESDRRRATEKAMRDDGRGLPPEALRELEQALEPGEALAALLVEHVWARALEEAVGRTDGTPLVSRFVDASGIGELTAEVLTAARS
jgi:hypothetical protein